MHGAQPPASPSTPLLQSCPHRDHAGPTASPGQPRLTCTSPSTVLAGGPGPSPGCRDKLGTQCHQVRAVTGWLPWHKEHQGRHLQALLLQLRAGAHGRQGWRPWEQGQAGREGTPSPFPVYLGRRHFLQPFVCEAAPPAPHPAFLRAAGHGAGGCTPGCVWGCAHTMGPPSPYPTAVCRLGPPWGVLSAHGTWCWARRSQPHAHRSAHTGAALMGCSHGLHVPDACPGCAGWRQAGCRRARGVHTGCTQAAVPPASPGPRRRGCHSAGLVGPAIVAATALCGL